MDLLIYIVGVFTTAIDVILSFSIAWLMATVYVAINILLGVFRALNGWNREEIENGRWTPITIDNEKNP